MLGAFPQTRLRRLRQAPFIRELVRETRVSAGNLVQPLFVAEGALAGPIAAMPGCARLTLQQLADEARRLVALGVPAIALFPVIPQALKSDRGEESLNPDGLVPRAIEAVKAAAPTLGVIVDIALDPYTTHGHDGVLTADGAVDNDATVEVLRKQALAYARAGADVVAPSDMMDGRIGEIRRVLERDSLHNVLILSYAAKYASAFYGPFRDAVGSSANLGKSGKQTYQMDPANSDEALREVALDIAEGADMVMVKPGMPYLDIIQRVKAEFGVPVAAYQVSGEYSMMKAAAAQGMLDERAVLMEALTCLHRGGADIIFTYYAAQAAEWLQESTR